MFFKQFVVLQFLAIKLSLPFGQMPFFVDKLTVPMFQLFSFVLNIFFFLHQPGFSFFQLRPGLAGLSIEFAF